MGADMTMNENEPVAWLVTWTDKDGNEWVHAHASEGTAFDQSQQKNGILQPLYTHPAPAVSVKCPSDVCEFEIQNEALQKVNAQLLEALKPFAVFGRVGSRDVEVRTANAAIAAAEAAKKGGE